MGRGWIDKVLHVIGFETVPEEGEEAAAAPEGTSTWLEEEQPPERRKRGTLVSLPGPKSMKVIVVEPRSFDEVQGIADHLKSRRPVILNLEQGDKDLAQRVLSFLSGTIYALNGTMQRVGNGIFFFAPNNVDIQAEGLERRDMDLDFWRHGTDY